MSSKKMMQAICSAISLLLFATTAPVFAEEIRFQTKYNTYGYPGIIDLPTAHSRPDGELAFSVSHFKHNTRNTVTFQISNRLSASFRYAILNDIRRVVPGPVISFRADRSFSVHYRFVDETASRPAIAVGLNDFFGTGIYSSEYFVASKTYNDRLRFTAGIGWGRLGQVNSFKNPFSIFSDDFEDRNGATLGTGGRVDFGNFFSGPAALFGGVEYQVSDKMSVAGEYSSDDYPNESPSSFQREIPFNFSLRYSFSPAADLAVNIIQGAEVGIQFTSALNPKDSPNYGGLDSAPPPVRPRTGYTAEGLGWQVPESVANAAAIQNRLAQALSLEGIDLHAFQMSGQTVRIEVENDTYLHTSQALGRTSRVLTRVMPPHIEDFDIVMVISGVPVTEFLIQRTDIEELEHSLQNDWLSYNRTVIQSTTERLTPIDSRYPRFDWSLLPYLSLSYFDPDEPLRADAGAELSAMLQPAPGLEFSGTVRKRIVGNLEDSPPSDSLIQRVRSDSNIYAREGDPAITELTAAYVFKPGENVYGRVTVGYLEPMYGGVSAEVLWKPVDSNFALGLETNYVKQRDFDQLFGFQTYDVATGHASAYWALPSGFHVQLDAGRYLAGDWGATLTIDREFRNGWKIGAFATMTDVPFDQFGEGSFDKGLRFTVPISWLSGQPNKQKFTQILRPVLRDGGARLEVQDRLYERIREYQDPELADTWGRFWR